MVDKGLAGVGEGEGRDSLVDVSDDDADGFFGLDEVAREFLRLCMLESEDVDSLTNLKSLSRR